MSISANPFMQPAQPMQLTVVAVPELLDTIELLLEEHVLASTRYVDAVSPHLVLIVDARDLPRIEAMIHGIKPIEISRSVRVMKLADIDWVEKVQKDFPPFALGRFYVYGSHAKTSLPRNHFPLLIDAVSAFGTGEHATTAGCLLALASIRKTTKTKTVLDVGCGTAILAIGAARLWPGARILACDNDPKAVEVSRINLKVNGIARRSHAWVSDGYRMRCIRQSGQHTVIVANILARPLMRMARDAAQQLAPGGRLVLSGLMNDQERMVISAYQMQGLRLARRIRRGKWSILVMQKGGRLY